MVPLGSCTEETQAMMQHKVQSLSCIWTCLLSACAPASLPVCEQISDLAGTNPSADVSLTSWEACWWLLAGEPFNQAESVHVNLKHAGGPFTPREPSHPPAAKQILVAEKQPSKHTHCCGICQQKYRQEQSSAEGGRDNLTKGKRMSAKSNATTKRQATAEGTTAGSSRDPVVSSLCLLCQQLATQPVKKRWWLEVATES